MYLQDIELPMKMLLDSNYLLDIYHLLVKLLRQQGHLDLALKHPHYSKNLIGMYLLLPEQT